MCVCDPLERGGEGVRKREGAGERERGGGRRERGKEGNSNITSRLPLFTISCDRCSFFPLSRLNIQVEFQQPNKQPVPIFLYDVTVDDSITVLSARVRLLHVCSYSVHVHLKHSS